MDDHLASSLSKEVKCRDSLVRKLLQLLSDSPPLFPSIFVYGHVSCGKSFLLQKILAALAYNYSRVNCLEHTNNKSLFEKIVVDLSKAKLSASNAYRLDQECDDFVKFKDRLKRISQENPRPIAILLENSDRLRDMDANLLPALLRLQELSGANVCAIFLSDVVFEKFKPKLDLYAPIKIHFPQYTSKQVAELLLHLTKPDGYEEDFYKAYLNLFLATFYRFCRDLNELRYMALKNFERYVEPIEARRIDSKDQRGLWHNIAAVFKANLEVIYLRVSTDDFRDKSALSREIESTTKLALSFELPYYAKYLLLAAFLASYNPAKEDKRLFMREGGPRKKRAYKSKSAKHKLMNTKLGPQSFPLRRLLAIFCSIIDERVDLNAVLLTQVPTMCQLGLLSAVGDENIDEPKYKCCVNFEFAQVIAKNVAFELKSYLYDYLQ